MSVSTLRNMLRARSFVGGVLVATAVSTVVGLSTAEPVAEAKGAKVVSSVRGSDGITYSATNHLVDLGVRHNQPRREWLLAWAGDAPPLAPPPCPPFCEATATHHLTAPAPNTDPAADPDFIAVVDATKGSPTYGRVVNTVTVGPITGNEPHHMQYVWHKGDRIYAGGFLSDTTYVFDAANLPALRLAGVVTSVDTPCGSVPDAYTVLSDGTAYGSYMGGPDLPGNCRYSNGQVREGNGYGGSPGEIVRIGPNGRVMSEIPAATAEGEDPDLCHNLPSLQRATCANPHGIQVREDLDLMVTSDLFEGRNFLDVDPIGIDGLLGRTTIRIFDIRNRNNPRLLSVSRLPEGPREDFPEFKENQLVMENSVTNLPEHRGAFASTMAGGAVFYTPDISASNPVWREVFDDETAFRAWHPDGPWGGGDTGSWLQVSPDDKYLFHAVVGHNPFDPRNIPSGMVYVLDIQRLLASGNQPQCNIDLIEEGFAGGQEPDCPALVDVVPIADETSGGPHWGALDNFVRGRDGFYHETTKVRRLAVANYLVEKLGMDGDHRLCMLNFVNRDLSIDETFRDEHTGTPCVEFNREVWPHGATGFARPHGVLFAVADADVR